MGTFEFSSPAQPRWHFVLYRAGRAEVMILAESTLRRLCDLHLPDRYSLEVIDILADPASVPSDVLAVPTVIRVEPKPERRVVGDLSQSTKAAEWLGLTAAGVYGDQ